MNTRDLHTRIGESWPAVLCVLGIADTFLSGRLNLPCPACGGRDRFTFDNRQGRGDFFCRKCGPGDGFTLLMRVHNWDFTTARQRVEAAIGLGNARPPIAGRAPSLPPHDESQHGPPQNWSAKAEYIWHQTIPVRGSLGERYLLKRECAIPSHESDVRFLPPRGEHPPSLCARVTDAITGSPISLHFTNLRADGYGKAGGERDKHLLSRHRKRGGVIRLCPDSCVTQGLALTEGIESGLAAARMFAPIWAAIDAGNMAGFPVLLGIEALTIIADNDEAGIRAADACATRWRDARREVRVRVPLVIGEDAADIARRVVAS